MITSAVTTTDSAGSEQAEQHFSPVIGIND